MTATSLADERVEASLSVTSISSSKIAASLISSEESCFKELLGVVEVPGYIAVVGVTEDEGNDSLFFNGSLKQVSNW